MSTPRIDPAFGVFDAVLFDRDGTLVADVPYNGRPERVTLMPGAMAALDLLRQAGMRVGMVTNQSGIGRGWLPAPAVDAVNQTVARLVGGLDTIRVCPHAPEAGCTCRKPAPGLVFAAAADLGVAPQRCVVVGDIGADVAAAAAAGATGLLVPTQATLVREVAQAPAVVDNLLDAARWVLARQALCAPAGPPAPPGRHVLVVR